MNRLTEGRIVHFVLDEPPHLGEHRPAIVVRVWRQDETPENAGICNLQVFTDCSNAESLVNDCLPCPYWRRHVLYSADPIPGTWHWIEQA